MNWFNHVGLYANAVNWLRWGVMTLMATAATTVVVVVMLAAATAIVVVVIVMAATAAAAAAIEFVVGGLPYRLNTASEVQVFARHGMVEIHHNFVLLNGLYCAKQHLAVVGTHGQAFAHL